MGMMSVNGDRYEGNWVANQRSGRGKMMHQNGDYYDGTWLNDRPNNQGTMVPHKADQKGPGGSIQIVIRLEVVYQTSILPQIDAFVEAVRRDVAGWIRVDPLKVAVTKVRPAASTSPAGAMSE